VKALIVAITGLAIGCLMASRVALTRTEPPASVVTVPHFFFLGTPVSVLAFSPDGATLAAYTWAPPVQLWDVATWTQRASLEGSGSTFPPVCYSPDGRTLAVCERGQGIALFNVATSHRVGLLALPDARVSSLISSAAFSRNGTTIIYVETRRPFSVFSSPYGLMWVGELDVATGQSLWREGPIEIEGKPWPLPQEKIPEESVKLSADGGLLAYVRRGVDRVELWDTTVRRSRATTEDLGFTPRFVFSPDARRMAVLGGVGIIVDTLNGKVLYRFPYQAELHAPIPPAAFSPDARLLAIGLPGGGVQLLDVAAGQMISAVRESNLVSQIFSSTTAVAFSPDGRTLAVGAHRGKIKLWEVARLIGTAPGG